MITGSTSLEDGKSNCAGITCIKMRAMMTFLIREKGISLEKGKNVSLYSGKKKVRT